MPYRRQFLKAGGALTLTPALSSTTADLQTRLRGWSPPDDAREHSQGRYGFIFQIDDGAEDALEDWVDRRDHRRLESRFSHDATGRQMVIAKPEDIGLRNRDSITGSDLLTAASWVNSGTIELNRKRELADPVNLETGLENDWLDVSWMQTQWLRVMGEGVPSNTGVAFDRDMTETTMLEARQHTGALTSDLETYDLEWPDTADVTIAVADTGINDGDPFEDDDGETRILEASKSHLDDETGVGAIVDENGHGTAVAAYAAANTDREHQGYAPDARLLGCQCLDGDGAGETIHIADAITYAADEGADVVILSLGSMVYSETIQQALEYAVDNGTIPVAAAGNDRQLSRYLATPASSEHAIAVGATTVEDPEEAKSAYFSNHGPHDGLRDNSGGRTAGANPTLGAPGCETVAETVDTRGRVEHEAYTGTSMAAPKVGGIVALLVAHEGRLEFDDVVDRLERAASPIPNAAVEEVGAGMPHLARTLADEDSDDAQADVMTQDAAERGAAYDALSNYPVTELALGLETLF